MAPTDRAERPDLERRGKCENCDSRGGLFRLPTGHDFCLNCTSAYVSWEQDGGVESDPDLYAWLWEPANAPIGPESRET